MSTLCLVLLCIGCSAADRKTSKSSQKQQSLNKSSASHDSLNPAGAQPSEQNDDAFLLAINPYFESVGLAPFTQYWEDPTGKADVSFASEKGAFKPVEKLTPNFNYTGSAYWFRFRLQNDTDETTHLILDITYPVLDRIQLCIGPRHGPWSCREGGDAFPFESRRIRSPDLAFPIDLAQGENSWVYLRVKTSSSMRVPMTLSTTSQFDSSLIISQLGWGLFFGWLIVMLIHNLLLWIVTWDRIYDFFAAYLAIWALLSASL